MAISGPSTLIVGWSTRTTVDGGGGRLVRAFFLAAAGATGFPERERERERERANFI